MHLSSGSVTIPSLPLSLGDLKSSHCSFLLWRSKKEKRRVTAPNPFPHKEVAGGGTHALVGERLANHFSAEIQWHFKIPTEECPQENKCNYDAHAYDQGMSNVMSVHHKQISFNFLVRMTAQAIQHHFGLLNLKESISFFFDVIAMETG